MTISSDKNSKSHQGNTLYNVYLNGGKVKFCSYADDVNGVAVVSTFKNGRIIEKVRRGKVVIVGIKEKS